MVDQPELRFKVSANQRLHIARVSIWVFLNNMGNVDQAKFDLVNDNNGEIVATKTLTGSQIKTLLGVSDNYSHGKLFLNFDNDILIGRGEYRFRCNQLTGFSASTFISWCRDWESQYTELYEPSEGDFSDPYYMRLYDREDKTLL